MRRTMENDADNSNSGDDLEVMAEIKQLMRREQEKMTCVECGGEIGAFDYGVCPNCRHLDSEA